MLLVFWLLSLLTSLCSLSSFSPLLPVFASPTLPASSFRPPPVFASSALPACSFPPPPPVFASPALPACSSCLLSFPASPARRQSLPLQLFLPALFGRRQSLPALPASSFRPLPPVFASSALPASSFRPLPPVFASPALPACSFRPPPVFAALLFPVSPPRFLPIVPYLLPISLCPLSASPAPLPTDFFAPPPGAFWLLLPSQAFFSPLWSSPVSPFLFPAVLLLPPIASAFTLLLLASFSPSAVSGLQLPASSIALRIGRSPALGFQKQPKHRRCAHQKVHTPKQAPLLLGTPNTKHAFSFSSLPNVLDLEVWTTIQRVRTPYNAWV